MEAVVVRDHGGPEVLVSARVEDPAPGPEEVLVRVRWAGVNFIDTYHRSGAYAGDTPFVPGVEGAGEVVAVGSGETGVQEGDRVAWFGARGAYAELQAVPAEKVVPVPAGLALDAAAAGLLQGMTAHYLTRDTFALREGHTCLVHAVAGGTGSMLCQLARRAGARVLGTTSTEEKAHRARAAGADEVILYTERDFREAVMDLTGGVGVDVVYDGVGRATFMKGLDTLRRRGTMVLFGAASGPVEPIDPQLLNQKGSLFLTRPSLFHHVGDREELLGRSADVFAWIAEGALDVTVDSRWALADAAEAHRRLESRASSGKLLLEPQGA